MRVHTLFCLDYFDLRYHHTAPISTVYALREGLAALAKEGIEESVTRHQTNVKLLYEGIESTGVELFVQNDVTFMCRCISCVKSVSSTDSAPLSSRGGAVENISESADLQSSLLSCLLEHPQPLPHHRSRATERPVEGRRRQADVGTNRDLRRPRADGGQSLENRNLRDQLRPGCHSPYSRRLQSGSRSRTENLKTLGHLHGIDVGYSRISQSRSSFLMRLDYSC